MSDSVGYTYIYNGRENKRSSRDPTTVHQGGNFGMLSPSIYVKITTDDSSLTDVRNLLKMVCLLLSHIAEDLREDMDYEERGLD